MAEWENLKPGDRVNWLRPLSHAEQLVPAVVVEKSNQKVKIRFQHKGLILTRHVEPRFLRITFKCKEVHHWTYEGL